MSDAMFNDRLTWQLALMCLLVGGAAAGCSKGDPWDRVVVAGRVSLDGKSIDKGQIRFVPSKNSAGPITIAAIENGKYSTSADGGVVVGTHRVEIRGYDPDEYAAAPKGPGDPPVRPLVPAKYNRNSELSVTLTPSSPTTLDFALTP